LENIKGKENLKICHIVLRNLGQWIGKQLFTFVSMAWIHLRIQIKCFGPSSLDCKRRAPATKNFERKRPHGLIRGSFNKSSLTGSVCKMLPFLIPDLIKLRAFLYQVK
jgi:hypothetical protein